MRLTKDLCVEKLLVRCSWLPLILPRLPVGGSKCSGVFRGCHKHFGLLCKGRVCRFWVGRAEVAHPNVAKDPPHDTLMAQDAHFFCFHQHPKMAKIAVMV